MLGKAWRRAMRSTEAILVKRYAESRLYDTVEARYVTLDDLRQWQARGIRFEVREAEAGEDISRVLLA
jgi:polyhydroxyalkanoate synthesis regulator protein